MTELSEAQRVERGEHARRALEQFLDPAFDAVIAAYSDRIEDMASKEPWSSAKITVLANAIRIAKEARAQIAALVYEGENARASMVKVERMEKLTPAKRRFLNIA